MNRRFLNAGLVLGMASLLFVGLTLSVRSAPQALPVTTPANVAAQVWADLEIAESAATADSGETDFLVMATSVTAARWIPPLRYSLLLGRLGSQSRPGTSYRQPR